VDDDKDGMIKPLPHNPDEVKMASCWGTSNEWRLEHMKLLVDDDKDGMIKSLPHNWRLSVRIAFDVAVLKQQLEQQAFFFDGQQGGVAPHLVFVFLTAQNGFNLVYIDLLYMVHLDRCTLGSLA